MKTWLFNPFKFIAGNKALLLGIGAMLVTAVACFLEKQHLDGVVDVHGPMGSPVYMFLLEPLIDWACLVIPLYIFGSILSTSAIRFIDVAGTSALARYPLFFVVLASLLTPTMTHDPSKLVQVIMTNSGLLLQLILLALVTLPFTVWTVALMYNAYSLSANVKGAKAIMSFIASILIAEIISKIIINSLL